MVFKFKVVKIQILRFLIFYDGSIWDSKMVPVYNFTIKK